MAEFRIGQLVSFMQVFGIAAGARLWGSMKLQLTRGDDLTLKVPGLGAPLHLRRQDLPIFDQVIVHREEDLEGFAQASRVRRWYEHLLSQGKRPVILDCGGHVGFSAVWFASRFPLATVYSVEPEARNFRLLQTNAAPYLNIIPLHGGVWSHACELEIINPDAVSSAFQVRESQAREVEAGEAQRPSRANAPVRGYTVDEILRSGEDNHLLLIKVDVEGAEAKIFQGPNAWLAEATAVVIELHDWLLPGEGSSRNFFRWAAAYDFEIVQRGENLVLFKAQREDTAAAQEVVSDGVRAWK